MYFKHNIHQVLWTFISYSSRFPVTLRISYEQSSWVRGENTSLENGIVNQYSLIPTAIPGVHPQPLLPGEVICEGSKLSQAACVALSCCQWDGQDCHYRGGGATCPATTVKPATTAATTNTGRDFDQGEQFVNCNIN